MQNGTKKYVFETINAAFARTCLGIYLGMYNTGRPSNFRLGLRSPDVERIYFTVIQYCRHPVEIG